MWAHSKKAAIDKSERKPMQAALMNVIGTLPKSTYDISVSASSLAACIESSVS